MDISNHDKFQEIASIEFVVHVDEGRITVDDVLLDVDNKYTRVFPLDQHHGQPMLLVGNWDGRGVFAGHDGTLYYLSRQEHQPPALRPMRDPIEKFQPPFSWVKHFLRNTRHDSTAQAFYGFLALIRLSLLKWAAGNGFEDVQITRPEKADLIPILKELVRSKPYKEKRATRLSNVNNNSEQAHNEDRAEAETETEKAGANEVPGASKLSKVTGVDSKPLEASVDATYYPMRDDKVLDTPAAIMEANKAETERNKNYVPRKPVQGNHVGSVETIPDHENHTSHQVSPARKETEEEQGTPIAQQKSHSVEPKGRKHSPSALNELIHKVGADLISRMPSLSNVRFEKEISEEDVSAIKLYIGKYTETAPPLAGSNLKTDPQQSGRKLWSIFVDLHSPRTRPKSSATHQLTATTVPTPEGLTYWDNNFPVNFKDLKTDWVDYNPVFKHALKNEQTFQAVVKYYFLCAAAEGLHGFFDHGIVVKKTLVDLITNYCEIIHEQGLNLNPPLASIDDLPTQATPVPPSQTSIGKNDPNSTDASIPGIGNGTAKRISSLNDDAESGEAGNQAENGLRPGAAGAAGNASQSGIAKLPVEETPTRTKIRKSRNGKSRKSSANALSTRAQADVTITSNHKQTAKGDLDHAVLQPQSPSQFNKADSDLHTQLTSVAHMPGLDNKQRAGFDGEPSFSPTSEGGVSVRSSSSGQSRRRQRDDNAEDVTGTTAPRQRCRTKPPSATSATEADGHDDGTESDDSGTLFVGSGSILMDNEQHEHHRGQLLPGELDWIKAYRIESQLKAAAAPFYRETSNSG